ncbi:MAG: transposase family protein [Treponema sp.]|jgi:hypothetical protein|nr:transposase family protein [Treponema sp.]
MIPETVPPIIGFFSDIKDPRIGRTKCYPLIEVIPKHDAYRRVFSRLNHLAGARAAENRLAFALVKTGSTLRNLLRPTLADV